MILYPNAKINIGLNVVEKRSDGYHNLETIFYPIPLTDSLEVNELPLGGKTCLILENIDENIPIESNLVYKAYALLKSDYHLPEVEIKLNKNIPTGAGLGGGSADAAFMLRMLNEMFDLDIHTSQLEQYASKLGADCAFFVKSQPQFATGIGDEFTEIDFSLKGKFMVLVKPKIHVSTGDAYRLVVPKKSTVSLLDSVKLPIENWCSCVKNDFEFSVFVRYPEIELVKNKLYESNALYASMSGSGAAVYGIFEEEKDLRSIFGEAQYFSFWLE